MKTILILAEIELMKSKVLVTRVVKKLPSK